MRYIAKEVFYEKILEKNVKPNADIRYVGICANSM